MPQNEKTRFLERSLHPQTGAPAHDKTLFLLRAAPPPSDIRANNHAATSHAPIVCTALHPRGLAGARDMRNAHISAAPILSIIRKTIILPDPTALHEHNTYAPAKPLPPNITQRLPSATTAATYIQRLCRNFSMLDICAALTSLQLSATIKTRHLYSAKTLPRTIFATAAATHTTQRLFSLTTSKITFPGKNLLLPAPTHSGAPLSYRQNHRTRQKAPFQSFQQ